MPKPPYAGPETETSRRVIDELFPKMPEPVMLIGGWGVYFTVNHAWRQTFGENYFGSRDIDLGFHVPRSQTPSDLRNGNLPRTIQYLQERGFVPENMYQFLRYHDSETHERLKAEAVRTMAGFRYYAIAVDLIVDDERSDIRDIAGFQAFAEPLLAPAFTEIQHRRIHRIGEANVHVPAPHVLIAMKLRSLPGRQKDHKSVKDLCDLYALAAASGEPPAALKAGLNTLLPDASRLVADAASSRFLAEASGFLEVRPQLIAGALRQLA